MKDEPERMKDEPVRMRAKGWTERSYSSFILSEGRDAEDDIEPRGQLTDASTTP